MIGYSWKTNRMFLKLNAHILHACISSANAFTERENEGQQTSYWSSAISLYTNISIPFQRFHKSQILIHENTFRVSWKLALLANICNFFEIPAAQQFLQFWVCFTSYTSKKSNLSKERFSEKKLFFLSSGEMSVSTERLSKRQLITERITQTNQKNLLGSLFLQ